MRGFKVDMFNMADHSEKTMAVVRDILVSRVTWPEVPDVSDAPFLIIPDPGAEPPAGGVRGEGQCGGGAAGQWCTWGTWAQVPLIGVPAVPGVPLRGVPAVPGVPGPRYL